MEDVTSACGTGRQKDGVGEAERLKNRRLLALCFYFSNHDTSSHFI